jgi:hypothetical protein
MALLKTGGRILRVFWRMRLATLLALALPTAGLVPTAVAALPSAEYQIKAVFLFNFAQFVEWPPRVFKGPATPLVIGVLGEDPFGSYLDEVVKGEKIGSRPVVIRRYRADEDFSSCHLLFVSPSAAGGIERIAAQLAGKGVLTLGDGAAFCRLGGMIGFVMDRGKVRLRINLKAATAADLTISSKLLTPATIVSGDK